MSRETSDALSLPASVQRALDDVEGGEFHVHISRPALREAVDAKRKSAVSRAISFASQVNAGRFSVVHRNSGFAMCLIDMDGRHTSKYVQMYAKDDSHSDMYWVPVDGISISLFWFA